MQKAKVNKDSDLIYARLKGDVDNLPEIPNAFLSLPNNRLRYDGTKVVDISAYTTFYIDENGIKHIVQHEQTWQEITCQYDDELVYDDELLQWKVKTTEIKLAEKKTFLISILSSKTKNYITKWDLQKGIKRMPEWRQNSWQMFMQLYEKIQSGTTLTTTEQNYYDEFLDDGVKDASETYSICQLVFNWIANCKRTYTSACNLIDSITDLDSLNQITIPIDEDILIINNTDNTKIQLPAWDPLW